MISKFAQLLAAVTSFFLTSGLIAQQPQVSKVFSVRDGLPQSYVSGISQDKNGFLWISTLNGFSRYDGRGFKHYWHTSGDSIGLSSNIILYIVPVEADQLLLCYMDGKLDLFNTVSEKIIHLGNKLSFDRLKNESGLFKTIISNNKGLCWMIATDGGVNQIDIHQNSMEHFTASQLKLNEPVLGLAFHKEQLLILTKTSLSVRKKITGAQQTVYYPFHSIKVFDSPQNNFYSPWIRKSGELIITDADGITIWNPASPAFKQVSLPRRAGPGKLIAYADQTGNYFFEYNSGIYILRPDDSILQGAPAIELTQCTPTSMYIDRSSVLWVGTNGFGLRQYNLMKSGMPGYTYQRSFVIDVLSHYGLTPEQATQTFLSNSVSFANRTATWKSQVWIADVNYKNPDPRLVLFEDRKLSVKTFRRNDLHGKNETHSIKFISFDMNDVLWGIDQQCHLLRFNTDSFTCFSYPAINLDPASNINGLVPDSGHIFYISTPNKLVRFDASAGATETLTGILPSKDLLTIANDPDNKEVLWIGTLSDGLIRFNKTTRRTQVYSMATGLPNNTIYSIIPGNDQQLWCSSNKGVFAFNKNTQDIRSFTSRDGLIDDEFNRYYYMKLPDTSIAFGGPMGYTLFRPGALAADEFDPSVTLTGLSVSNLQQLPGALASIKELRLTYNQNFITAEFAAMQFDFPDKIQYRYQLTGFDKSWIIIGNENKASYTGLPPGKYTLLLNASNTSGKWSSHVLSINIIIAPPFWNTWWFYVIAGLVLCLLIYFFLQTRIRSIKKTHARQLQFEREAMELNAMALRAQMNPHFIFNCLNSIKALIQEKQDKHAIKYLTTFVSLIRKQLNNTSNRIALADELQTCKLYLELEAMRFDGHIDFHFDIADEDLLKKVLVPPLSIQPVIENAIIHGLLPREDGGRVAIKVFRENDQVICEIRDNGIGRAASTKLKQNSSQLHESKGMHLLEERISLHNRLHEQVSSMETVDAYDTNGQPDGTLVIFKFNIDL